jgi:excisionase family DNA binding protein
MPSSKKLPSDELISLAEAAKLYGFDQDYLRQLIHKGRLRGRKIGRNWVTTPRDMEQYITNRQKTGTYREDIKP